MRKIIFLVSVLFSSISYSHEWETCHILAPSMSRVETPSGWLVCVNMNYSNLQCFHVKDSDHEWNCILTPENKDN